MSKLLVAPDSPILREIAKEVTDPGSVKVAYVVGNLRRICTIKNGLGLAAPQIGVSLRIIHVKLGKHGHVSMINPRITRTGSQVVEDVEGCLSLPTKMIRVRRKMIITVEWEDMHGDSHKRKLRGRDARVIQHEIDHLDGILITDYAK